MSETLFNSGIIVRGAARFLGTLVIPSGAVDDDSVATGADIDPAKLRHQNILMFAQDSDATAAAQTKVVDVVQGAGEVYKVDAGMVSPNSGDATVTVDLHKNGVSILSSPIELSSSEAAYALVSGTVATTAVVADDVLEVVVTVNAGTGTLGNGPFVRVVTREDSD